jgi:hypothetical protein
MVGMLIGVEMSLDDAILDTGDVGGTNYFTHLVMFVFSGGIVPTGHLTGCHHNRDQ